MLARREVAERPSKQVQRKRGRRWRAAARLGRAVAGDAAHADARRLHW
jgi:hypothetical protein